MAESISSVLLSVSTAIGNVTMVGNAMPSASAPTSLPDNTVPKTTLKSPMYAERSRAQTPCPAACSVIPSRLHPVVNSFKGIEHGFDRCAVLRVDERSGVRQGNRPLEAATRWFLQNEEVASRSVCFPCFV